MPFSTTERQALLSLKGVGPKVIERLEQLGFHSLADLKNSTVDDITQQAASMVGSTCWKNSPQAKTAIANVLALASTLSLR
ncbi:helix-hairpin-helix domain-containing protein [Citrobacter youngae]|uniref:helix-hairpin-helix domain-containing protein n=1 Tax=Citrobacter TaxID=544 RepID=UPI000EF1834F|nr:MULTISPECIES: helix-hairpin-helix domain-containing protein [Citrobacter]AYL61216.1 Pathogenicity locus [Citrobacter pasteurii]MBA8106567.1 helix-hairpin-helix domain-containing protein [Citrobacter sp. RHBSTW-00029]MBJ9640675.1 helix-hairpin-helix domain-containing protein [Citrobacter sp. FDAARGOS_156]MDU5627226.1 helix-hairpin-helix domain-containing protein [Citrobacter sp.]NHM11997.1 helix-hairpin-helix domain-containing protein [Citrobacter youngae]